MSNKRILHKVEQPERGNAVNHADYLFWCPGCKCGHGVWTTHPNRVGAIWTFNGNMDKPTFAPSLNVSWSSEGKVIKRCHSFVRDGQIQFLGDCTHELAGKTVPMEAF